VVRGAGGASLGFFASARTTFGLTGTGFCSGATLAGSGSCGVACFWSGGATTSAFSCGGVGAICSSTASCFAASGGDASACCMTGPGARSSGVDCGAEVVGAMSTMMAGKVTPGGGGRYQNAVRSATTARCRATIASAEELQRRASASSAA
jgi:hypothetical protein